MIKLTHAALAAGVLVTVPALAQTTPPAPPAPQTTPATPAPVTDEEVTKFAKAALAADAVSKDAAIPATEKQAKMAEAVVSNGLEATRFNEIAQASQSDPALQQKVQAAIIAIRDAKPATPAGPAATPTPTQTQ
ncbi:DUF4168 domain-containing protein [Sphingomonas suaedae]|uniref:DUF4168 domain-containing protein n=1 Tax=Sphingomonas suaedae TaxID=2599297 RepID=UPI0016460278|nr:DUF4168 domain-containing protein [Sphingomonas suaedae]